MATCHPDLSTFRLIRLQDVPLLHGGLDVLRLEEVGREGVDGQLQRRRGLREPTRSNAHKVTCKQKGSHGEEARQHTYTHTNIYIYIYIYIYTYIYICLWYMCIYLINIYTCACLYIHVYIYIYIRMYILIWLWNKKTGLRFGLYHGSGSLAGLDI